VSRANTEQSDLEIYLSVRFYAGSLHVAPKTGLLTMADAFEKIGNDYHLSLERVRNIYYRLARLRPEETIESHFFPSVQSAPEPQARADASNPSIQEETNIGNSHCSTANSRS
jgi:hypothetical protein